MSLNKQMMIFIASLLLVLLLGTFALNLNNTRHFLQDQLSSHAQDTATSLGLSLSTNADPNDLSTMETMINAVFDRGYYSDITLTDLDNNILYQRTNPKEMEAVPAWFIDTIDLQAPTAEAVVQSGWMPTGTLSVTSHAGYAYIELWKAVLNLSMWFGLAALIAMAIIIATLRWMLKPLKAMEKQAEAIVRKEYLLQESLPTTTEFKQVVSAMNAMVKKMKTVFERDAKTAEKLQKMAYQDSVTGLSNRRHFEMLVDTLLDPEEASPGMISLIRIHDLKALNDRYGYLIGDQLMKSLASKMLKHLPTQSALFARLNGTELVALTPGANATSIQNGLQEIANSLPELLTKLNSPEASTSVSIAFKNYIPGDRRASLLAALDYAIQQADNQGQNQVFYASNENNQEQQLANWKQRIEAALKEQRFTLFQQSTHSLDGKIHDKEVFIRLRDEEGTVHSAGYFMPAVEQTGYMPKIEKRVIQLVFDHLKRQSEKHRLAINLTRSFVLHETLPNWLEQILKPSYDYRGKLAFELNEQLILEQEELTHEFIQSLQSLGITIGIDHFGSRFTNMRYLQALKPDYVKLDAAFTKAIESDEQTQSYVSSLCEMADSLDIKVIAMAVENDAQRDAFKALGVHLFQGYLFSAPKPLDE